MKILIVEDKVENIYFLKTLLKSAGYKVVSASNGVEALEKLKKESFDLIISDILMPKMDGFQLCRQCKANEALRSIPFIFYTATYTSKKDEEFGLSLGADEFLVKPLEPNTLLGIIKRVIKKREKRVLPTPKKRAKKKKEFFKLYNERLINKLEDKMLDLEKEIAERKKIEKKLNERIKELSIVYETSIILEGMKDLRKALTKIVNLIPAAMMHPGVACAQLTYNDFKIKTKNFKKTKHGLFSKLNLNGKIIGLLEVYYSEKKPFLKEKQGMLNELTSQILNITEHKKAEKLLREGEEKFRTIFEKSTDGIMAADAKTKKFVFANKKMTELTGYSEKELLKLGVMSIHPKKDLHYVIDQFTKQLKREITVASNIPILRKDKKIIYCDVCSSPIKIRGQKLLLGLFRDITEHRQAEKVKLELEGARKLKELRDEFLMIITHDLKQPLTPIIGYAEILKDDVEKPKQKGYLDEIIRESFKLHEMVDKILNLLKIETGKLKLNTGIHNLGKVFNEAINVKKPSIDLKKIKIVNKIKDLNARFDYKSINNALLNLIDNAIKFTKQGGEIIVKTWIKGGHAYASVKDKGVGIRKKDVPKLFTKFYQTKEGEELGGTGIGLAVSKDMVKAQKGGIIVKSKFGKGAEFIVKLPRK